MNLLLSRLVSFIDFRFPYICVQSIKNFVLKICEIVENMNLPLFLSIARIQNQIRVFFTEKLVNNSNITK